MVSKVTTPNCCFLNLRTGAVLIGIVELVVWSIIFAVSTLTLSTISEFIAEDETNTEIPMLTTTYESGIQIPQEYEPKISGEFSIHTLQVLVILSVALSAIRILNGSILILGVHKNSPALLKIWLGVKLLSFLLTIGSFVASLIRGFATVTIDFFYGLSLLASIFFIWVILSLLARMKLENKKRAFRYKY